MATKTTTLADFAPSPGVADDDLIYMMKGGVEVRATPAQFNDFLSPAVDLLSGATLDGGDFNTPAINYQLVSVDGGTT